MNSIPLGDHAAFVFPILHWGTQICFEIVRFRFMRP